MFPTSKKNITERLIVFLISSVLLLLALELALRFLGGFYHQEARRGPLAGSGAYTILSIGDSYTFGIGAPPGQSYPSQLEKLLNSSGRGNYSVINLGQPGQTSTYLLGQLQDNIDKFKPGMVILMAGFNNCWNYLGYARYMNDTSLSGRSDSWLYRIKLYKLARLLSRGADTAPGGAEIVPPAGPDGATPGGSPLSHPRRHDPERGLEELYGYKMRGLYDKAEQWLKAAAVLHPGADLYPREEGRLYCELRRYPEALERVKRAVKLDPDDPRNYQLIGEIYRELREPDEALKWLNKALALDPRSSGAYSSLARIYQARQDGKRALELFRKAIMAGPDEDHRRLVSDVLLLYGNENDPKGAVAFFEELAVVSPECGEVARLLKRGGGLKWGVEQWIASDIGKFLEICKKNGIRLVLMNYPADIFRQQGDAARDDIFSRVAKKNALPFVDNRSVFQRLKGDYTKYFAPDGHCNAMGYGLVARNIQSVIKPVLEGD